MDSVVRADAVRLRAKVREYYESEGKNDPIRFDVPKGRRAGNQVGAQFS